MKGLLPNNRRQMTARRLVEGLLPTTEEVRGAAIELDLAEAAFTLVSLEPPYNQGDHVGYRILAKRNELGFKDDDGLVFTVPVTYSRCGSEVTRSFDFKNAKFKRVK